MAQSINTRLILRNDTLANWQASTKVLLKGEVALALSGDKYEIRIGDGDKTWSQLSSTNFVLPVDNVLSLDTKLQDFQIVSADLSSGETGSSYKLQTKTKSSTTWSDVANSRFNVPATDLTEIKSNISTLSSDVDDIKQNISNGVHFIGTVVATQVSGDKGQYKLTESGSWIDAVNGDIVVIKDDSGAIEYIWSDTNKAWEEFGDEGHHATVTQVETAKQEAIDATTNTVTEISDSAELTSITSKVKGDIAVVKTQIGSTGKYQYTGYAWNGTSWQSMDGDYSTEHVILPSDMTITYAFGKYSIPSSGSLTLSCAGKTLKEFLDDAFAEVKSGTVTNPTFTLDAGGNKTGEVGTTYTLPAATLKMTGVGAYQYGPATGITVPATSATVKCTTSGYTTVTATNSTAMALNSTLATTAGTTAITYLSTATNYTFSSEATYTDGAIPKNNIGGNDTAKQIKSAKDTKSITVSYTGLYPAYYGFTTSPKSNPTAITANNGNVTIDGITYTRVLNNFNVTSFTASSKWYELFYMIPTGKHTSWSGKDSNNVDLAIDTKTTATVTFQDGKTAVYDVFVVRNAAQYSATTCKMTFN